MYSIEGLRIETYTNEGEQEVGDGIACRQQARHRLGLSDRLDQHRRQVIARDVDALYLVSHFQARTDIGGSSVHIFCNSQNLPTAAA